MKKDDDKTTLGKINKNMSLKRPTVQEVIYAGDSALEGDNRHEESASRLWEAVDAFIEPKKKLKAAKALMDALRVDWKGNLQYVTGDTDDQ
jgi:hypothetical protein